MASSSRGRWTNGYRIIVKAINTDHKHGMEIHLLRVLEVVNATLFPTCEEVGYILRTVYTVLFIFSYINPCIALFAVMEFGLEEDNVNFLGSI